MASSSSSLDEAQNITAGISNLHPDLLCDILRRLDGTALAASGCTSKRLRTLAEDPYLWQSLVTQTWSSISSDSEIHRLIGTSRGGFRSFYNDAFPLLTPTSPLPPLRPPTSQCATTSADWVSIIELSYQGRKIFSKVLDDVSATGHDSLATDESWFSVSPLRIEAVDPKDDSLPAIPIPGEYRTGAEICRLLGERMRLTWIILDKTRGRAANLTSWIPLEVQRHWFSDKEYVVKFGTVLPLKEESIYCGIYVKCGGCEEGELRLRELSLAMEDMEGRNFSGRESLEIWERAVECRERRRNGTEEVRSNYEEFLEAISVMKNRKVKKERGKDLACTFSGILISLVFCALILVR